MDKYLIINADDFGMCRAANMAVADLFQKGGITSATIMTPCGWAKNAGIWAKNNPEHAVGVHLTFTSEWGEYRWGPVATNNTDSLRDSEGFMHHESDQFEEAADLDEVESEIRAQIERFKSFGIEPSHLDNIWVHFMVLQLEDLNFFNLFLTLLQNINYLSVSQAHLFLK